MSAIDKDYMPFNTAVSDIIAWLTQDITSVKAWHWTNDRSNTLAHVLQKGVKDLEAENAQLKARLAKIESCTPGGGK